MRSNCGVPLLGTPFFLFRLPEFSKHSFPFRVGRLKIKTSFIFILNFFLFNRNFACILNVSKKVTAFVSLILISTKFILLFTYMISILVNNSSSNCDSILARRLTSILFKFTVIKMKQWRKIDLKILFSPTILSIGSQLSVARVFPILARKLLCFLHYKLSIKQTFPSFKKHDNDPVIATRFLKAHLDILEPWYCK